MSSEKVSFFFHAYFIKNKEKHVEDEKFGNDAMLSASSASSA